MGSTDITPLLWSTFEIMSKCTVRPNYSLLHLAMDLVAKGLGWWRKVAFLSAFLMDAKDWLLSSVHDSGCTGHDVTNNTFSGCKI